MKEYDYSKQDTMIPSLHVPFNSRVIPNDMIRSSLFTVCNSSIARDYYKNKKLFSFYSTDITYTGEELRQDDMDVWMELIFLASSCESDCLSFRPYQLIGDIGRPKRPQYKTQVKDSLERMSATNVTIYNNYFSEGISLSLVRKFQWNDAGGQLKEWHVWLEPEVVKLFEKLGHTYSKVHWEQRKKLKPLAKWLHAFYSTHAEPQPIHLSKILKLCGSRMSTLRHFKENIRKSLLELVQVGFLVDYHIDIENVLHVDRKKQTYTQKVYAKHK